MPKKSLTAAGLGLVLAVSLGAPAVAVADTPSASTSQPSASSSVEQALASSNLSPALQAKVRAAFAKLPANWAAKREATAKKLGLEDHDWRGTAQGAINPSDYECSTTKLDGWLDGELAGIDRSVLRLLSDASAFDVPTYDALVFGKESSSNTFGVTGDDTNPLNHAMKKLRGFWDIDGSSIQLIPMHGSMMTNPTRVSRVYEVAFGLSKADADEVANAVVELVKSQSGLRGGDNPIFTFNAFAYDPTGDQEALDLGITKRIVMGDGVLAGLDGVGLTDKAAAEAVLAHEYGHQVQYAKGLFESPLTGPEATRRTELMADALGTYAMVHSRGLAVNAKRTLQVNQSFYQVGDCSYTSDGHHGTPNQRLRASQWAVSVVDSNKKQGHKLTALQFDALFEKALPSFVAPGA